MKKNFFLFIVSFLYLIYCGTYFEKEQPKTYKEAEDLSELTTIHKRTKAIEDYQNAVIDQKSVTYQQDIIYNQEFTKKRQIVYESQINIQVRRIDAALNDIQSITNSYKGYIESSQIHQERNEAQIKLRIPVDKFFNALDELFKIGNVISYQIRAEDVTRKLHDVESRLTTLKKLRDRLYELFKNVKDVQQKAKILKEINRLTSEIEDLEAKQKSLKDKATFSTINIYLSTKEKEENSIIRISPFDWIRKIDPLKRTIFNYNISFYEKFILFKKDILQEVYDSLKIPPDFFDNKEKFIKNDNYLFYNSSGVGIRLGYIENEPIGTKDFWTLALREEFIKRKYNILIEKKAPKLNYIHLEVTDGINQYFYTVGMWIKHSNVKSYIIITEIYYPKKEDFEKYKKIIEELF